MSAKWPILALLPALSVLMPAAAMAADAELGVIGGITPAACQPAFSQGGVIDFGIIGRTGLEAGRHTRLERKRITLTVTCSAPASFGIRLQDNRSDSVPATMWQFMEVDEAVPLGLGNVRGVPVGGYRMGFVPSEQSGDGRPVTVLERTDASDPWATPQWEHLIIATPDSRQRSYSWATTGLTPGRYSTLSALLDIQAVLVPTWFLPMGSDEVVLDGSATLTLFHL